MAQNDVKVSVVAPVYNECETLPELAERLSATLNGMHCAYEIIFVDDGSTDGSREMLYAMSEADARVRVVELARNFGQSPALYAGMSRSRGEYTVIIDSDLQVMPEDIPLLVSKLEEGYDVAVGWRVDRHDSLFRKYASRMFNLYVARVTGLPLHDYGCNLKAMRREILENMCRLQHRCRYLPADLAMLGGRVAEVKVGHAARAKGQSKYNFMKLVRAALDMLTGITDAPLRLIGYFGWAMAMAGFAMGVKVIIRRLTVGDVLELESVVALFLFCTGVQLVATGLMCEYIGRIFVEVQQRPYFVIHEDGAGDAVRRK
jgi:undecaprenyl-phosphate 4-deoxy-4-formamido-L-arabinose transferase